MLVKVTWSQSHKGKKNDHLQFHYHKVTCDIDCVFHSFVLFCRVDFVVPGIERVGGFSMYTSPTQLVEDGTLGLAVKRSPHEPAQWVHTKVSSRRLQIVLQNDLFIILMYEDNIEGEKKNRKWCAALSSISLLSAVYLQPLLSLVIQRRLSNSLL